MHPQKLRQRKVRFVAFVAATADGRISLTKKTMPRWTSKEDWLFFQRELARADAVVVGRGTYEAARTRLQKRNTIVLTRQVSLIKRRGTVLFVNPKYTNVEHLFDGLKMVAIAGGAEVYRTMLDLKLLDEIFITVEPFIFGRGKEIFSKGDGSWSELKLLSIKRLNRKGTLLLHYKVI